jgi:hypothetical protein
LPAGRLAALGATLAFHHGLLAHAQGASAAEEGLIGKWTGTWTGDSTGTFTMTIVRDDKKKLGGSILTRQKGQDEAKVVIKSVVVNGSRATIKYDTPGNTPSEVTIEATVDGKAIKGAWTVMDPATKKVESSGTFTGSKS